MHIVVIIVADCILSQHTILHVPCIGYVLALVFCKTSFL